MSHLERWESLATAAGYNANSLASLCHVSVRQLQRQFRRTLGRTPQDWLDERRLAAAEILLRRGYQVKRVAFDLGFKQSSHFCRQFKIQTQLTPSEFATLASPNKMSL